MAGKCVSLKKETFESIIRFFFRLLLEVSRGFEHYAHKVRGAELLRILHGNNCVLAQINNRRGPILVSFCVYFSDCFTVSFKH